MTITKATTLESPRRFLTRRAQSGRYGKSVKTIERWGKNPDMGMPAEYDFNGLPSRLESELSIWERSRVTVSAAQRPNRRDRKQIIPTPE
jgi:hypothetical protein